MNTHPLGRYTITWPISPVEQRIAVYEITGKKNDVWLESSHLPSGRWMPRHYFETWIDGIKKLGGVISKPTSKGWKRIGKPLY